jgi:hypothetical protein
MIERTSADRWPSGRRRTPAKGVRVKSPSRVRIPLCPPVFSPCDTSRVRPLEPQCAGWYATLRHCIAPSAASLTDVAKRLPPGGRSSLSVRQSSHHVQQSDLYERAVACRITPGGYATLRHCIAPSAASLTDVAKRLPPGGRSSLSVRQSSYDVSVDSVRMSRSVRADNVRRVRNPSLPHCAFRNAPPTR